MRRGARRTRPCTRAAYSVQAPHRNRAQAATHSVLRRTGAAREDAPRRSSCRGRLVPSARAPGIRCRRDKFLLLAPSGYPFPLSSSSRSGYEPYLRFPVPNPCARVQICELHLFAHSFCYFESVVTEPNPQILPLSVQVQKRPWIR